VNDEAHFSGVRLLTAGIGSLILLSGVALPVFVLLGSTLARVIPAVLCIFILVILTPVVIRGSWGDRLLALVLAVFPALLLLSIIVSSFAFPR
jgi:hypothetical protein